MDQGFFTSVSRPIPVAPLSVDSTPSSYAELVYIDDYTQFDVAEPPRTRNPAPADAAGSFTGGPAFFAGPGFVEGFL